MSWTGPNAAVSWDRMNNIRVYGQDPNGNIMESVFKKNAGWAAPVKIGAKAKYGTELSAVVDSYDINNVTIRLYYYADDTRWREMVFVQD